MSKAFRNHLHFIIIVPLLIIVMTWPTVLMIADVNTLRWPTGTGDILMKFWDAWYGKLVLAGQADYFDTDLLFYPNGLSLAYHNFSLPNMIVFGGLQTVLPAANSYMLTFLLTLLANVTSAYIALWYLLRNKWAALSGAVLFGICPYLLAHPHHPEVIMVATLPLSLYAFHRGVMEKRMKWIVVAGALCGITAFIGMYIFVCLLLTMGIYSMHLALRVWREARYWKALVLLLAVAAAISMIRIYPMITNAQKLDAALNKASSFERSSDLLVYFVNGRHPLAPSVYSSLFSGSPHATASDGYLGLVPLFLIGLGFLRPGYRRIMMLWLAVALFFAVLRLGSVLKIGGVTYADILLPKHYLENLFPWIFRAFWDTTFYHIGLLLPFAILVCYSLTKLLGSMSLRRQATVSLLVVVLVVFEYYQPPLLSFSSGQSQNRWIEWMRSEDSQDSVRIVNLPMGRQSSKPYVFYQTLNGYPQAEGLAARTPNETYRYIDSNLLLTAWRQRKNVYCLPTNEEAYSSAVDQLLTDGFTHIVVHRGLVSGDTFRQGFINVLSSYEDENVTIYRIQDLYGSCNTTANLAVEAFLHRQSVAETPAIIPNQGASMLSIHTYESIAGEPPRHNLTTLKGQYSQIRITREDVPMFANAIVNERQRYVDSILSAYSIILFVYDPSRTEQDVINTYGDWISRHFKICERLVDDLDAVIEHYIRPGFPCELAIAESPFAVEYDIGIQLGNLWKDVADGIFDIFFLWNTLPRDTHSVSIQFFDADGNKAYGQDFVIGHDPLARHRLTVSSLAPGEYVAKLIVYNYDTGVSVPGTVTSSQTRFDRELEIARISVD